MDEKCVIIKIERSDGQMFILGEGDWLIYSDGLDGIDFADNELYTEKVAFGDGVVVTGSQFGARNITINAVMGDSKDIAILRNSARKFFNASGYTYKLTITYQGETRWIRARLNTLSLPSKNVYQRQELKLLFLCPDPYFKSVDDFGEDIAKIEPNWAFPWIDTADIVPTPSYKAFSDQVNLANNGDATAYPVVYITFTGDVINPTIEQEKGFVKVLGTYGVNDQIIIDTVQKKVFVNGQSAMSKVSADSSLLALGIKVGGDWIKYSGTLPSTETVLGIAVSVYYNQLYGGL